jgi:hypothetical protein
MVFTFWMTYVVVLVAAGVLVVVMTAEKLMKSLCQKTLKIVKTIKWQ